MPRPNDDLKRLRDKPVKQNGRKPLSWSDIPVRRIALVLVVGGLLYGLGAILGSSAEPRSVAAILRFAGKILLLLGFVWASGWLYRWALNN